MSELEELVLELCAAFASTPEVLALPTDSVRVLNQMFRYMDARYPQEMEAARKRAVVRQEK